MSSQKPKTILYIYPGLKSTFIEKDIRLLSLNYQVKEYSFNTSNKKMLLWELLKQKTHIIWSLWNTSIFLIKFGGYWSLIPVMFARIFGKKAIIITGGTDCVDFPEIGYGNFNNKPLAMFTQLSFLWANHIIALHQNMILYDYVYQPGINKQQGLKAFIPNLKTPFSIAYNGYDADFWKKTTTKEKATFITVAIGLGETRRRILKGIDIILEVAVLMPESSFIIIGTDEKEFPTHPSNVILKPKANSADLIHHYSKAQFYLQLSMSEGFPNSLCEAMLCECVPVVSNVASMPFIVGNSGFVLKNKDTNLLKTLLQEALESDTETLGQMARKRIADNFTEEERSRQLFEAIELTLKGE